MDDGFVVICGDGIDGPKQAGPKKGGSCFVYPDRVLKGDA